MLEKETKWMKTISASCTAVVSIIIIVLFVAAFGIPGGSQNSNVSIPTRLKKSTFGIAARSHLLSLPGLDIPLHSNFLLLPTQMLSGLSFLFLSLLTSLVGLSSSLYLVMSSALISILLPPLICFMFVPCLYVEMLMSTYRPRLFHPLKIWN